MLQRVRLTGPLSNKALLGAGWADSAQKNYTRALAPWLELRSRNILDSAVQESYLAVPYAYAQLDATKQAAEQYTLAVNAFSDESKRIDESIAAIRSGRLLDAIMDNDKADKVGWYWQLQNLPDAPETRYLYHLLASNEFQEGLKNYRDLRLMQTSLSTWTLTIEAFGDMVDTRRRAFEQRVPGLQRTVETVDMDALEAHRNELESRVAAIERDTDGVGLATERELEQWHKIERIEQVLQRADPADPDGRRNAREGAAAARHAAVGLQFELQGALVEGAQGAARVGCCLQGGTSSLGAGGARPRRISGTHRRICQAGCRSAAAPDGTRRPSCRRRQQAEPVSGRYRRA